MAAPTRISRRGLLISGAMLAGAGLAVWIRPDHLIADEEAPLDLEKLIPRQFGNWQVDSRIPVVLPAPDVQAAMKLIYAQTVARTYVNSDGRQVMLSIAYGRSQSDAVQVHKPEGCYQGQGFGVGPVTVSMVELVSGRQVPIRRMVANRSDRNEPVSYYTLIGTVVSSTSWREKVTQLRYGLSKRIPDGLLMRVSSIGNAEQEVPEQDAFLRELIQALPPQARVRVVGTESYA